MLTSGRAVRCQCTVCDKSFSRVEHLQRHLTTHTDSRPFRCQHCSKAFSRRDAVFRHERTRHQSTDYDERAPAMRRACVACSVARIMCSGGHPCPNCNLKNRPCVYVKRKRRRQSLQVDTGSGSRADADDGRNDEFGVQAVPFTAATESQCEYSETSSAGITSNARAVDSEHEHELFASEPHNGDYAETAMNWLPFDPRTPADELEVLPENRAPPATDVARLPSGAPGVVLADVTAFEREQQADVQQPDSLTALIASMGRASRVFGNGLPVGFVSEHGAIDDLGSLYSNGAGSRSSQAERAMRNRCAQREDGKLNNFIDDASTPGSDCSWLQTLETSLRGAPKPGNLRLYQIPAKVYGDIITKVDGRTPFSSSNPSFFLSSRNFPTKDTLDHFVRLYFEHFHPVYPFLDLPLLNMPIWGWSLCLATASIGCRYSNSPGKDICGDALSIVLRETLLYELQIGRAECTLSYLQALLLNTLALCQSDDTSVMALGEEAISSVMNRCLRFCLFAEPDAKIEESVQIQGDINQMWTAWRCREMRRRTGFFAWILDCSLSFTRTAAPVLSLQIVDLLLPSSEMLWEADSAQKWRRYHNPRSKEPPEPCDFIKDEECRLPFRSLVIELFENLKLIDNISQFASIGCIYALLRRHGDMTRYLSGPFFMPEDPREKKVLRNPAITPYPAAIPDFVSWRNRACDYMDTLHWDALGNSAKAGGLEGPLFLQLHLGRLLLLAPVKELLTLAEGPISDKHYLQLPNNVAWQSIDPTQCQQIISTWAHRDRYKARLAVVHAGATFWHVRRYGTDSFVQPFTVYLAAVVLHYYAQATIAERLITRTSIAVSPETTRSYEGNEEVNCTEPATVNVQNGSRLSCSLGGGTDPQRSQEHPQIHGVSRMPAYFYIDRPVDDELVQQFVRNGETSLTLCAEAIEDLCSADGARQILLEAAMLLVGGNVVWPIARKYAIGLRAMCSSKLGQLS